MTDVDTKFPNGKKHQADVINHKIDLPGINVNIEGQYARLLTHDKGQSGGSGPRFAVSVETHGEHSVQAFCTGSYTQLNGITQNSHGVVDRSIAVPVTFPVTIPTGGGKSVTVNTTVPVQGTGHFNTNTHVVARAQMAAIACGPSVALGPVRLGAGLGLEHAIFSETSFTTVPGGVGVVAGQSFALPAQASVNGRHKAESLGPVIMLHGSLDLGSVPGIARSSISLSGAAEFHAPQLPPNNRRTPLVTGGAGLKISIPF